MQPNQAEPSAAMQAIPETQVHSLWWYSWRRLKRNKLAMLGLVIMVLLFLCAGFAWLIAPMNPNRQILEYARKPSGFAGNILVVKAPGGTYPDEYIPIESYAAGPEFISFVRVGGSKDSVSRSHLISADEAEWHQTPTFVLGTDRFGRDVLSRLLYGARVSLSVALFAEIIAIFIGVLLGALAGYFRGTVDAVIMWFTNVIWSFPFILLVLVFSLTLKEFIDVFDSIIPLSDWVGRGAWQTFLAIGLTSWVDTCRIVRGQFFSLRETEYVEATRAVGFGPMRTIFRHILPNALGPIIVVATAGFASAIIAEASLSFVGHGIELPTATWGQMIYDGLGFLQAGQLPGLTLYPSIAIALAVFAINVFGDGLRDALDSKMKV